MGIFGDLYVDFFSAFGLHHKEEKTRLQSTSNFEDVIVLYVN